MMLDQLWFSIRIIKTTLLESIPVAESFDAPAKMQNRAITRTRRFVMPSSTLRTGARPERKRSEGHRRASKIRPPPDFRRNVSDDFGGDDVVFFWFQLLVAP